MFNSIKEIMMQEAQDALRLGTKMVFCGYGGDVVCHYFALVFATLSLESTIAVRDLLLEEHPNHKIGICSGYYNYSSPTNVSNYILHVGKVELGLADSERYNPKD